MSTYPNCVIPFDIASSHVEVFSDTFVPFLAGCPQLEVILLTDVSIVPGRKDDTSDRVIVPKLRKLRLHNMSERSQLQVVTRLVLPATMNLYIQSGGDTTTPSSPRLLRALKIQFTSIELNGHSLAFREESHGDRCYVEISTACLVSHELCDMPWVATLDLSHVHMVEFTNHPLTEKVFSYVVSLAAPLKTLKIHINCYEAARSHLASAASTHSNAFAALENICFVGFDFREPVICTAARSLLSVCRRLTQHPLDLFLENCKASDAVVERFRSYASKIVQVTR